MSNRLLRTARRIRFYAQLSPFDTTTEEGRAHERHRRILLTAIASALAKGVMMLTMLISIPLTLHYLGDERFGLWMTIGSLVTMLGFADFGVGNGLINAISEADGKQDRAAIHRDISSALVILCGIALAILLVFFTVYPLVSWAHFFNVKSAVAIQEAGIAVAVFVFFFALNIPASVVQKTQTGLQLGYLANIWLMAGSLLGLVALLLCIYFELGLPWLVGAITGAPVVVALLNGALFFARSRPDLLPAPGSICRAAMKKVAHSGLYFLILQITYSIAFASDNVVISRVLGAEAVTQYALPETLFNLIPLLLGLVLKPLWPAYGEAMARGDGQWIRKSFSRSLKIAFVFTALSALVLVVFAQDILSLWTGHNVAPPMLLLLGLGIWKVLEGWGIAVATFLNGANIIRLQAALAVVMAVCAITLKVVLVGYMGVAGTVWATVVAYSLITFIPLSIAMPRLMNRVKQ